MLNMLIAYHKKQKPARNRRTKTLKIISL